MRRYLYCLPLLAGLGCAVAPDSTPPAASRQPDAETPGADAAKTPGAHATGLASAADRTKRPATAADMEKLARTDPVAFVAACVDRYDREVRGYRVTLTKRERVDGKLYPPEGKPPEVVRCAFREKPFSVLMDWKQGARLAQKTLYVQGENDGKLLVRPTSWRTLFVSVTSRDPDGKEARESSRYPITEFGIQIGQRRTLDAWRKARKRGDLRVLYKGVKRLPQLNKRPCWELQRVGYKEPEDDGIVGATLYFDRESWLQTGSVLVGEGGELIASYFFTDLQLNPTFPPGTFTKAALTKK